MAENEQPTEPGIVEIDIEDRKTMMLDNLNNPLELVQRVYELWKNWADFHLYIISPHFDLIDPPIIIEPELIAGSSDYEFVYPILDGGTKFSASKAQEMFSAGKSMCKMYYTIEKIIHLLIERLKSAGVKTEDEVQVALGGHEVTRRKAFESIINLNYNVVVTNFDPGEWGERFLQIVKVMADKGYGYPPEAPRDTFKRSTHVPSASRSS